MIYSVSTSAELVLAAKHASGGDTIQLAPGSYSAVTLKNLNFSTPVTITSADPGNPAVLSDFTLTSVNGLNIENVDVKVGEKMGMIVEKSSNIIIDHIDVVGASVEKPGGNGLKIDQSTDVVVKNSSFHELGYGLTHVNSERIVITSNTFENIRVDGIRGGGTSHIEISNNTLRNFFRDPGEHGDAIQFWTRSTTASAHDIVIRDNLIERGEGNRMQGIFMGDETKGKLPYVNVEITGNTILGTMYHGINLDSARGAIVSENTVVGYEDMKSWIRVAGSTDVEISRNIATQYTTPTDGNINVVRSDNLTVPQTSDGEDQAYIDAFLRTNAAASDGETDMMVAKESAQDVAPEIKVEVSWGSTGADSIVGTVGNDLIDGNKGVDTLIGGLGDDRYIVDQAKDRIVEGSGEGTDTVYATPSSYKLAANLENLILLATSGQTGTGNELDNEMRGNAASSKLFGESGNDTLVSIGGADTLTGGAGADVFRFESASVKVATVVDFVSGQDRLDLSSLLDIYTGSNPVADGWVKFAEGATGLDVLVDVDGSAGPASFVTVASLTGIKTLAASDWLF